MAFFLLTVPGIGLLAGIFTFFVKRLRHLTPLIVLVPWCCSWFALAGFWGVFLGPGNGVSESIAFKIALGGFLCGGMLGGILGMIGAKLVRMLFGGAKVKAPAA
jgi:hypothetical protein